MKLDSDVLAPAGGWRGGKEQLYPSVRAFLSHLALSPNYADRQIPVSRLPFEHS